MEWSPGQPGHNLRPQPVLSVLGLRKGFGMLQVLDGVDLSVHADELVALVGENGTGKTTLVRCIAGAMEADAGSVDIGGHSVTGGRPPPRRIDVVWQDLALCDNLAVVDNLFLGQEDSWLLPGYASLQSRAQQLLGQLNVHLPDLDRPVAALSGGQRQAVALARTLVQIPDLLILDEPTASLDSAGVQAVLSLIRIMRAHGAAILLISHDLDLVCEVADRAVVLRDGVVSADVRRPELTADHLQARIAGLEVDVMASQQLQGLRSLVDQLSEVKPAAVLPLIVSAVSVALDQPRLALHLVEADRHGHHLRLAAGLGLEGDLRAAQSHINGTGTSPQARALRERTAVVLPDVRQDTDQCVAALLPLGVRSMWTVPLVGGDDVLGTLSGYGTAHGPLNPKMMQLAGLYASHAAAVLERERLLTTVTRRNKTLETLRQMLETLAGPAGDDPGLGIALEALRHGLGAEDLALLTLDNDHRVLECVASAGDPRRWSPGQILPTPEPSGSQIRDHALRVVMLDQAEASQALAARWSAGEEPRAGSRELLTDGARSILLALERRAHEAARHEATTLRRSNALQRAFLSRLSHELRTPLTAIHGYADTLRQPDVDWDHSSTRRFLDTIAHESERLGHLVAGLLDASAIEAGVLRLQLDWCDLDLVIHAAVACVSPDDAHPVRVEAPPDLPPLRGDHDRLEQVLVNLIGNATKHTPTGTRTVVAINPFSDTAVRVVVTDDGPGLPQAVTEALFQPGVRAGPHEGSGLGLSITRGIVLAHGGSITGASRPGKTAFTIDLPWEGPPAGDPTWSLVTSATVPDAPPDPR